MHTVFSDPSKLQPKHKLLEEINHKFSMLHLMELLDQESNTDQHRINECSNILKLINKYQSEQQEQSHAITEMKVFLYLLKGKLRKNMNDPDYILEYSAVLRNEPGNLTALTEIRHFRPTDQLEGTSSFCAIS